MDAADVAAIIFSVFAAGVVAFQLALALGALDYLDAVEIQLLYSIEFR